MTTLNLFTKTVDFFTEKGVAFGLMIVGSVLIIVLGWVVASIVKKILKKALNKSKLDPSFKGFLIKTVDIIVKVLIILSAVSNLGISTTGLIAALSAAAVAVSLALKDSLGNIAGGILMMISRPFSTGDFIGVGSDAGTVLRIDLIHTTILTVDNRQVVIPNGQLVNMTVTDFSVEKNRRVDVDFCISYESDVEKAKEIILSVANAQTCTIKKPEPFARVTSYNDSSVTISARVWCKSADYWDLKFNLLEAVRKEFDDNGISIPYNQLDVHINGKLDK